MLKTIAALLLATAATAPALAQDHQDWHQGGGEHRDGDHRDGDHRDGGHRGGEVRQAPAEGGPARGGDHGGEARGPGAQMQAGVQVHGGFQRPHDGAGAGWRGQGQDGGWRRGEAGRTEGGFTPPAPQTFERRDRAGYEHRDGADFQRHVTPGFDQRAGQGWDRRGGDRQGWERRDADARSWENRGGDQRGWDRGRTEARHDWNRGWREDRRYDWRDWRDSHRDLFRLPRYHAPYGYGYQRFSVGARLTPLFFAEDYWISDPAYYRLPPAYGPYHWVRYYNDALLVDVRTGYVIDMIPDFFW